MSVTMVLLSHVFETLPFAVPDALYPMATFGPLGVRAFFVISGFLITHLLLEEHRKYGSISLFQFYFRRTSRIFPALYAFVLAMLAAQCLGWIALWPGDALHALTYTTNYHHERAWEIGHLWSLAVEEQFYLLWPALFLVLGVRGAACVAAATLLAAPAVRVLTWLYLPEQREGIGESFQTVADPIATGCVLAFVRTWLAADARFVRVQSRGITVWVLVAMIVAIHGTRSKISFSYPVGETMMNVCIALFLDWCLRNPTSRLGRFLNWAPMVHVGLLSYSLYLWQQPFMARDGALVTIFPLNLICVFGVAMLSYHLIESPFLRWRVIIGKKWLPRRTPIRHPAEAHASSSPSSTEQVSATSSSIAGPATAQKATRRSLAGY